MLELKREHIKVGTVYKVVKSDNKKRVITKVTDDEFYFNGYFYTNTFEQLEENHWDFRLVSLPNE